MAERANIVLSSIDVKAVGMHCMPASHENDGFCGGEQVKAAYGAICIEGLLQTPVVLRVLTGDTGVAAIAVKVVVTDTLPHTADLALVAVINVLRRGVVVKLAYVAKVPRKLNAARRVDTMSRNRLDGEAKHAHELFCLEAFHRMADTGVIMAQSTNDPEPAAVGLEFTIAGIMLAAWHFVAGFRVVDVGIRDDMSLAVHLGGKCHGLLLTTLLEGLAENSLSLTVLLDLGQVGVTRDFADAGLDIFDGKRGERRRDSSWRGGRIARRSCG